MGSDHTHEGSDRRHAHSILDGNPREHGHACEDVAACQAVLDGVLRLYDLCWHDEQFKDCLRAAFPHAGEPPYEVEVTEKERLEIAFTMVVSHLHESSEKFAEQLATNILIRSLVGRAGVTVAVVGGEDSPEESMVDRAIRMAMEQHGKEEE